LGLGKHETIDRTKRSENVARPVVVGAVRSSVFLLRNISETRRVRPEPDRGVNTRVVRKNNRRQIDMSFAYDFRDCVRRCAACARAQCPPRATVMRNNIIPIIRGRQTRTSRRPKINKFGYDYRTADTSTCPSLYCFISCDTRGRRAYLTRAAYI